MSWLARLFPKVFLALAALGLFAAAPDGFAQAPATNNISLRILYAGKPGSAREADFLAFLKQHFRQVDTARRAGPTAEEAVKADVILLDWDGDGFKAPERPLPEDYTGPVMTISVAGGLWASGRGLKTGYT
jgi:hypothetical protein